MEGITELPDPIGKLTQLITLSLNNNQLTSLPDSISNLQNLTRLDLQNNQFTHIPRVLLNLPAHTEIFLRDNPLSHDEIRAVRAEIEQRRVRGLPVPQFILPELPVFAHRYVINNDQHVRARNNVNVQAAPANGRAPDNTLRLAAQDGLNVHAAPLTNAFKARLDKLASQFTEHFNGNATQQTAQLKAVEQRLLAVLKQFGQGHAHLNTALEISQKMFKKAYGQQAAHYNDFKYSSGRVLAYVVLAMEAQWRQTPQHLRPAAKENGAELLMNFMAEGKDFCDTRHIEEVLQMISLPLSDYAQQHPEITKQIKAVAPSASQVRDLVWPVAQQILQQLMQQQSQLQQKAQHTTLQNTWRTQLEQTIQNDYPAITKEQLNALVQEHIVAHWDLFVEMTLPDLPAQGQAAAQVDDEKEELEEKAAAPAEQQGNRPEPIIQQNEDLDDATLAYVMQLQDELNEAELMQAVGRFMQ